VKKANITRNWLILIAAAVIVALIAANKDDAELVIYTATNINLREKQLLLQRVKEARIQYFNRSGYEL